MIKRFADRETERVFQREFSRRLPPPIQHRARIKLEVLDAAEVLEDLRIPPSNRLEALSGDRRGQHSIRINEQWRICFVWREGNAHEVGITDYH
jgi:proteic killer suppression protein